MPIVPPRETRAPRIEPITALPLFFNLHGRRTVVAGGHAAAAWKIELLAAAGAGVDVYAAHPADETVRLAEAFGPERIRLAGRPWRESDLEGAALAVGALTGAAAAAFAAAARKAGVPVNIVDTPDLSTFHFGTIVNRSPVTVGIATGGAAPVLGQAIRARIEALLHPALGLWAAAAQRLRETVNARLEFGSRRREAWRRFAQAALSARHGPAEGDIERLVFAEAAPAGGSVTLAGAGPGDPELVTLKTLRALQTADVILYDRLVAPEVLELARREANRILVGKTGHGAQCRQEDITALLVRLAGEGRHVVRLKGGDPLIFGRASEEIAACRAAGLPVEVIPGVTAALGAAAELTLPLTDRKLAKRLQIVTGHAEDGRAPEHDWPSLADPWATTVFYMGARTFRDIFPKLLAAGLDPAMPSAIVSWATTPRRQLILCPAGELADRLADAADGAPRLILMGRVVGTLAEAETSAAAAESAG